ncbi:MAG TPA: hypothetical protein PK431_02410 [Chitinophagales bacterium]|nr:hypothetical protein [Chitinophagales bacterium]
MEIKILNSIIFNELVPWLNTIDNRTIAEKLKKIGNKEPKQLNELEQQIKTLINDYPEISKWIDKQIKQNNIDIKDLCYTMSLPSFTDAFSKYYSILISKETIRVYNAYLIKSLQWTDSIDINYHTTLLLRKIKNLTKQVSKKITERDLETQQTNNNINFVLQYLKHSLITLFFSIQEVHKEELEQVISLEDFYLLELALTLADMQEITFIGDTLNTEAPTKAKEKLSFGYTGDKEKLKSVLSQLNTSIELLFDEMVNTTDLYNILTAKSIIPNAAKFRLGCETVKFSYIVNKLSPFFNNLTPTAIEESGMFYSKKDNLIKAQNLYSGKISNPKNQDIIDKIIKHLQ